MRSMLQQGCDQLLPKKQKLTRSRWSKQQKLMLRQNSWLVKVALDAAQLAMAALPTH